MALTNGHAQRLDRMFGARLHAAAGPMTAGYCLCRSWQVVRQERDRGGGGMLASARSSGTTRTAAPWPWPAILLRGPEAAAINLSAYPGILFAGDSGAPNDAGRIVDALKSAADQELRSQSGSPARLDKRLHSTPVCTS